MAGYNAWRIGMSPGRPSFSVVKKNVSTHNISHKKLNVSTGVQGTKSRSNETAKEMRCLPYTGHGVFKWTHPSNTDAQAFNACSQTHGCAPVIFYLGNFQATFPTNVGTVVVHEMWKNTTWKFARDLPTLELCSPSKNWINTLRCTFETRNPLNPKTASFSNHTTLDMLGQNPTLYVVGDSTMKRLYDVILRKCPSSTAFTQWGKLHQDIQTYCSDLNIVYLWSAGTHDTSTSLDKIPAGPSSVVIFNTGHNYIVMGNHDTFTKFAHRMYTVVKLKRWSRWTLVLSPAMNEAGWSGVSLCTHNNVRVQMTNTILTEVFPAQHTVDMFHRSLSSGHATDGVHYTDAVYGPVVDDVLNNLRTRFTGNIEFG